MTATTLGPLLTEPVWYSVLREPTWLVPRPRESAPRVVFAPAPVPPEADDDERELRLGLPLVLAEAARFTTDARAEALTVASPEVVTAAIGEDVAFVVDPSGERPAIRMVLANGARPGVVQATLETLSGASAEALRDLGAKATWSTFYVPPKAVAAPGYARAQRLVLRLQEPEAHTPAATSDETAERRRFLHDALRFLSDLAARAESPFGAILFFAGMSAVHDGGTGIHHDFRIAVESLCARIGDPRHPVFRLSVLTLEQMGDLERADERRVAMAPGADLELRRWLLRTRA